MGYWEKRQLSKVIFIAKSILIICLYTYSFIWHTKLIYPKLVSLEDNILHIFTFQEGAKSSEGVIVDYDKFIIQKINEFPVTFR